MREIVAAYKDMVLDAEDISAFGKIMILLNRAKNDTLLEDDQSYRQQASNALELLNNVMQKHAIV